MLSRRWHKFGTMLGLLAIWLTVLAPAISQTLASYQHQHPLAETALEIHCSSPAHGARGMGGGLSGAGRQHSGHESHHAMGHMQACAYCGFFAHSPVVSGVATIAVAVAAAIAAPRAVALIERPLPTRFATAQPRAPPVVC